MMMPLQSYVRQGKRTLRSFLSDPRFHVYLRAAAYVSSGFLLSAASLQHHAMPLAMGLVCAASGWSAVLVAGGGALGYLFFWAAGTQQYFLWLLGGLLAALFLGDRRIVGDTPLLLPAVAGLIVSATGVLFQAWTADDTTVGIYLLRITLAAGSVWVFSRALRGRNAITDWLSCALGVLALAQIAPFPSCSLGIVAGGALAVMGTFPAAALAGLALDLSSITPVSMTAVLCGSYLVRFLPICPKWLRLSAPACGYLLVMTLSQRLDYAPLPGLLIGGIVGIFLPFPANKPNRRGETGVAQVRLEMVATVLAQTEQLLIEAPEVPIDEDALVERAAEQACSGCPCRKNCKDSQKLTQLPAAILHKPLLNGEELPVICRKSGRFLAQLHHAQEHLRSIRADRQRQKEYRSAVIQQYRFLTEFLQDLSDKLARRIRTIEAIYTPNVQIFGNRPKPDNGDRCLLFSGTQCRYYVILCDGMGTGPGAVQEGKLAGNLLQRLLSAGYPAEHALQTLNSLCALRSRAGAVTVELLELQLDSGKAQLFKWGAAPSYLISKVGVEKIGTASPPPGLSVSDCPETVYRLSLRRDETLVLVSDGVGQEDALQCCLQMTEGTPGELAAGLLRCGQISQEDDATVVLVRLGLKH